jgi:ribonucleoside-diphosphate reductase alpha chain
VEITRDSSSSLVSGPIGDETVTIPSDLRTRPIHLTDNARTVLQKRYLRRGEDGKPAENEHEMFWRVAYNIALAEASHGGTSDTVQQMARRFFEMLTDLRFFPNSPTFTGAGTPLGQLAACFVLKIDDDMGRTDSGIFQTLRNAALIQQTGGGNGFAFSSLRPKGAIVKSSNGQATGPVGFLRVYDQAFGEIAQGGSRRGANMAVLRVDHPDIREFIGCKTAESAITNFNISVGITDAFMRAVEAGTNYDLINPQDGKVWESIPAREIFDLIVKQAHHNGEPGVLFLDAANRQNPVPHLYTLESTNPCFVGSTRIPTNLGLLTIQEMAENNLPFMVATDSRAPYAGKGLPNNAAYGVAFREGSLAWKTREATRVMRLVTSHGYAVTATPDHKFLTPDRGYVSLENLQHGDRLLLQSGEGAWGHNYQLPNVVTIGAALATMAHGGNHASGATVTRRDFAELYSNVPTEWSHDLGLVMGWLVGDGWLSPESGSPVGMVFGSEKDEAQGIIHSAMSQWFGEGHMHERGSVNQLTYGQLPYRFFNTLGVLSVPAHEKRVPNTLWSAPREAVIGFLQGLFTADGTVTLTESKGSCSVRLASSSKALLEDVQVMLLNLGIVSKVLLRRASGYRTMPDGKGGHKDYLAQNDYELIIDKVNRDRFMDTVGFIDTKKQNKAASFIAAKKRRSNSETFETSVSTIEDAGITDVFDLTEYQTHSLIANGLVAHNCGEQFLGPFENCCLGSINLVNIVTGNGQVDWKLLQQLTQDATRFLDDVVTANKYVPAVPQLEEAAHRVRRIGLGIMGLGDLMYKLGVRYGSEEGQEFAGQITEFVRYHAMQTSIDLAKERGAFPAIKGSIYDPDHLTWQVPNPLFPYTRNWARPALNWKKVVDGIKKHGIRNGAQLTVAPTGTIATVSGCEAYGCEPVFALAYIRHVNDKGRDLQLQYTSPLFEQALRTAGMNDDQIATIVEEVTAKGSCQDVPGVPERIRHTFVVSSDISAEEHVRMQASMQAFVDNAISKTCNFSEGATEADVAAVYKLGWQLGCKGMTVYVTGSRDKVVLETHATAQAKKEEAAPVAAVAAAVPAPAPTVVMSLPSVYVKKQRPRELFGRTFQVGTPLGKTYVTINENGDGRGHPFEIFTHTSKAGSETAAVSEAIGRLISLILRLSSPITPRERLKEIIRQLDGIGGGRSTGFGPSRVRSLPDGIAQVLQEYMDETESEETLANATSRARHHGLSSDNSHNLSAGTTSTAASASAAPTMMAQAIGDLCPECGEPTLINEEGCRKCHSCAYSEC